MLLYRYFKSGIKYEKEKNPTANDEETASETDPQNNTYVNEKLSPAVSQNDIIVNETVEGTPSKEEQKPEKGKKGTCAFLFEFLKENVCIIKRLIF